MLVLRYLMHYGIQRLEDRLFKDDCCTKLTELDKLREYCNGEFQKISKTYSNKVIHISNEWVLSNIKY